MRSFSAALPLNRSQVHLTSRAVNGSPSCHLTPWRSGKVSSVPSSFEDQLVARSGTIDLMLFCGTSCLYITRLLKTPIIGRSAAAVDSSRSDMLAGLSKWEILRIPPVFWAKAASAAVSASDSAPAAASTRRSRFISNLLFEDTGLGPPLHPCWPVYWALAARNSVGRLPQFERGDHDPEPAKPPEAQRLQSQIDGALTEIAALARQQTIQRERIEIARQQLA